MRKVRFADHNLNTIRWVFYHRTLAVEAIDAISSSHWLLATCINCVFDEISSVEECKTVSLEENISDGRAEPNGKSHGFDWSGWIAGS